MNQVKDAVAAHAEIERLAKEKAVQEVRFVETVTVGIPHMVARGAPSS